MSVPKEKGWGGAASLPDFFKPSANRGGGELGGLEEADVVNGDTFDAPLHDTAPLPDFFTGGGSGSGEGAVVEEDDDWARQQAEFERLRKLQAARLQGVGVGGGGSGGPMILSLSALEGGMEEMSMGLGVGRGVSVGSNVGSQGDEDPLMAINMQQEVDRLTLDLDEEDEHIISSAVQQAQASRLSSSSNANASANASGSGSGPKVLSLQQVEALEAQAQQQAHQQQQQQGSSLPPPALSANANSSGAGLVMRPVPSGLLMSSRDVLYVIQQQLRQMAYSGSNGDAFSDDYYYTQARLREEEDDKQHHDKGQGSSSGGGSSSSSSSSCVLAVPVWKETREMARKAHATQVLEARARTSAWEEGNRVLGHTSKSAISRPRELLAIAKDEGEEGSEEGKEREEEDVLTGGPVLIAPSKPFTSQAWKIRKHVDEVQCVLLSLEECVLSLRNAYVLPDKATQLHDQLTLHQQTLALLLLPSHPLTPMLLELPKGLKALAYALPQLPPPSAHSLLPLLLTSLVTRPCPPPRSDWGVAEAPLLSSLLRLLKREPLPPLAVLCRGLEGVVKAYMAGPIALPHANANANTQGLSSERLSLRQALATRNRAEVLHTLLQQGKVQADASLLPSEAQHWKALQDKLIQMLQQP